MHMSAHRRNNVHIAGSSGRTMMFAHGYGCDQSMWRHASWKQAFWLTSAI
ncbi:hypothetical protein C8J35_13411 [Rhizobium sp. PP-F2F-G38]|nr:hypothetical protein C8J35_13411 [Rhizobium sp. PP-F2F-G38]